MSKLNFSIEEAVNEPIQDYTSGSDEKLSLKTKLEELKSQTFDIPIIINGKEVRTDNIGKCVMPHNHQHILATYHKAGNTEIKMAIDGLLTAWNEWSFTSLEKRINIFNTLYLLMFKSTIIYNTRHITLDNAFLVLHSFNFLYILLVP